MLKIKVVSKVEVVLKYFIRLMRQGYLDKIKTKKNLLKLDRFGIDSPLSKVQINLAD